MEGETQYNSGDIRQKDGDSYFVQVRKRPGLGGFFAKIGKKKLVIIGASVFLACVGIVVAVLLVLNSQKSDTIAEESAQVRLAQYNEALSGHIFGDSSEESFNELSQKLNGFIEEDQDQDSIVQARVMLASLYSNEGSFQLAVDALHEGLSDSNISDQNRLALLAALVYTYDMTGQQTELGRVIEQILQLPEDMVLEYADWSGLRVHYQGRLEQIMNAGG